MSAISAATVKDLREKMRTLNPEDFGNYRM